MKRKPIDVCEKYQSTINVLNARDVDFMIQSLISGNVIIRLISYTFLYYNIEIMDKLTVLIIYNLSRY